MALLQLKSNDGVGEQLSLFRHNLPLKARSCNYFDLDNKVRNIQNAIEKRYIQPNSFNEFKWLVFDIDRPVCPDELRNDLDVPEPTLFVQNPVNKHAHVFYLLSYPVHNNLGSSQKALRFASLVQTGLLNRLKADESYAGLLAKNPLNNHWDVLPTYGKGYDLHELSECLSNSDLVKPVRECDYGLGRNCIVFDKVSRWAYKAIRQGYPDYERFYDAVYDRAIGINAGLPTPMEYGEVKHIAKSVASWVCRNFSESGFSEWQSRQGKKGGIKSGKVRLEKSADKRSQACQMLADGYTRKDISLALNVHRNTVANWTKNNNAQ
jgi:hypothetical protein